ncbi:toprim domain-containing protein [Actinomadura flavalba]|uniref:toprim domain-containing protein n=1 Tax=Actinomadura flavalba TaxID=1120938 RepID=UPI0003AA0693|nr:toprim domain-containing protein [Actinomadura flavalba]
MPFDAVLRDLARREADRLRDGTLPWGLFLDRAARHGRHGLLNTLLIPAQWRGASDVRSYAAWRAAGRHVRRGETGIRVLTRSGASRAVFDVAQTDGLPVGRPDPCEAPGLLGAAARRRGLAVARRADVAGTARALVGGGGTAEDAAVVYVVLARLGVEAASPAAPRGCGVAVAQRVLARAAAVSAEVADRSDPVRGAAHRFFRARLRDGWVPAYLAGRGVPRGVQRRRGIGYAPAGPRALLDHLARLGHAEADIVAAGLAHDGRDVFRDRAMFAVRDTGGAIAGFLGRRADDTVGAKYLTSPGFRRGDHLYGLFEARDRLAHGARPVLVEGPLDALAVDLADPAVHAGVATGGSALTGAQLAALAGVADLPGTGVLAALDGDAAGHAAALRAWPLLRDLPHVDAVPFPSGDDPADLLARDGRAALRARLHAPVPLLDHVVDAAAPGPFRWNEERLTALRAATRAVAAAPPEQAARQAARLSSRLGLPHGLVTDVLTERF